MDEACLEYPSTARRRILVTVRPLPFRPPSVHDELVTSWIGRLAKANHCSVEELCGYLGLAQGRVPECAGDLRAANWARLCGAVQRSRDEIVSMALPETTHSDVQYVSRHDFQYCPGCVAKSPDLVLRHWRLAWSMACEFCGRALAAKYPAKDLSSWLRVRAVRGAEALKMAFATTDPRQSHRISLTLQVMSVLKIGHLWSLTSGNEHERLLALAAVGIGTTRPLWWVPRSSCVATTGEPGSCAASLPQHRRVIERIRRMSQGLDRNLPGRREAEKPPRKETNESSRPNVSKSTLHAAHQAITELGPDADRQALLARADAIWKRPPAVKS